jgi:hypothetical protein
MVIISIFVSLYLIRWFLLNCVCCKHEVVNREYRGGDLYEVHTGVYERDCLANCLLCATNDD